MATLEAVMITGATGGLGQGLARRLARRPDVGTVVLAVRDAGRGEAVRARLRAEFPDVRFELSVIDTASLSSVRAAAEDLRTPLDGLVLNAGGTGGGRPEARTADGVNVVAASNTVGHALLVELLIERGVLAGTVEYVCSEAAFGVPALRMPAPVIAGGSVAEFRSWIDGSVQRGSGRRGSGRRGSGRSGSGRSGSGRGGARFDPALAYGQAKLLGALWVGALARRHPRLRPVAVSPGNTAGTGVLRDLPLPVRVLAPRVNTLLGRAHSLDAGTERLARVLLDPGYRPGRCYASAEGRLTGPLVDQAAAHPELDDEAVQDHADEALRAAVAVAAGPRAR